MSATAVDHLVVAAATLDDGVRWCRETLGVEPAAGGRHALMGTHNRLLAIGAPAFARSYLEIIAIDPAAPAPARRRWFGLDEPALQAALRRDGPRLVHWVARCADLTATRAALLAAGAADPGTPTDAERADLRWRITLRDDGRPPHGGALPALIEWQGAAHPAERLPPSGVALQALAAPGLDAAQRAALGVPGLGGERAADGAAPLAATLATPRGPVTLQAQPAAPTSGY